MKRLVLIGMFIFFLLPLNVLQAQQIDINKASLEQIRSLPVTEEQAMAIYHYILFEGPLTSIYDLLELKEMDPETFQKIKDRILVDPYQKKSGWEERFEQMMLQMERWESSEGINQSLVDYWYEQALNPLPISEVRFDQLENLQGVSPVDAAAIIRYRKEMGTINGPRDLRTAPFLSYYGYRNASRFIDFEQKQWDRTFHGNFRVRIDDTPFMADEAEAQDQLVLSNLRNSYPTIYSSFTGSLGDYRFGFSQYHYYREPFYYDDLGIIRLPRSKYYFSVENQKLGPVDVRKLVAGYYSLAFGKGVIMQNTDYFSPRNTGFGFRKTYTGLRGDISINRQFALRGLATELQFKNWNGIFFISYHPRDAILNTIPTVINGKTYHAVNQFIVLDQRFPYPFTDSLRIRQQLSWLDAVNEMTYGMQLQYQFGEGNSIGYVVTESLYDKLLRPRVDEIVAPENLTQLTAADVEIYHAWGGPESDASSALWKDAMSYRRIHGLNFQYIYQNVALQGEYAELDARNDFSLFKGNPSALVLDAYMQFNSLNLFMLYRDYDLGFDNPYQRSFSNYRRYKRTIFEDYFYLQDPLYGQLYTNNPQPQAEKGFYINSRYQINRFLVTTLEYDNWIRKSDDAAQSRLVASLDIRPIFPLRINIRQKFQGREQNNQQTLEYFQNNETILRLRFFLSNYNQIGFLFFNSTTTFRPRPRLVYPVETGSDLYNTLRSGNLAADSRGIGAFFNYNYNEWLKINGYLGYYRGFMWNFEDTQFQVMNSINGAYRAWLSLYHRISPRLSFRLKCTWDHQNPVYDVQARDSRNQPIPNSGKYYQADFVQQNVFFYLFEMNYHF